MKLQILKYENKHWNKTAFEIFLKPFLDVQFTINLLLNVNVLPLCYNYFAVMNWHWDAWREAFVRFCLIHEMQ